MPTCLKKVIFPAMSTRTGSTSPHFGHVSTSLSFLFYTKHFFPLGDQSVHHSLPLLNVTRVNNEGTRQDAQAKDLAWFTLRNCDKPHPSHALWSSENSIKLSSSRKHGLLADACVLLLALHTGLFFGSNIFPDSFCFFFLLTLPHVPRSLIHTYKDKRKQDWIA